MRPRIQEPDPIRCFWRGTSFTNLLSTSLEFVGTIVGDLKEICSAPVRLLIVGGVGPVTEAMKGDSAFSPSHTFVQICFEFFQPDQSLPPKHQRRASQHCQIEAQQWQAQAPGDINKVLRLTFAIQELFENLI